MIIFPRDNSLPPIGEKFVEAMTTVEGQTLLNEGGFVPLEVIDEIIVIRSSSDE
ncbi:MAG: hypothetical protein F6K16_36070 [Symploca sp. SIO2B6]|nr:hypothetical protein [Symploca sp. SIO2B6]